MDAIDIEALRPFIDFAYSRAPGPGGQNVNKVNTRVTLLFDFDSCTALSDRIKQRIRDRYASRMSRDGRLRIVAYRHRTQQRNRADAEERLVALIEEVSRVRRARKATRPTLGSQKRRLDQKKQKGEKKRMRGPVRGD